MARPIPINQAGLRPGRRFQAQTYVPAWGRPQPAPPPVRDVRRQDPPADPAAARGESWALTGLLLFGVSGLTGGLAVISSLDLWSFLAASSLGLDERGAFFLLVSGIYLLATTFYAVWRTRLLQELRRAPWDARLMAYANLGVGGTVSAALGMTALVLVAILLLLAGFVALLLSGTGGQPQG